MANLKSDGKVFDANLVIATGVTITAGSMICVDVSGTNTVRAIRAYSGTTVESAATPTGIAIASLDAHGASATFLGVICKTQTGVGNLAGGSQTGVTWYPKGVFEFNTTPTASCALVVGRPVWAATHDTVICRVAGLSADPTGTNGSGTTPIGYVTFLPRGPINTNTVASTVRVMINADVRILSTLR